MQKILIFLLFISLSTKAIALDIVYPGVCNKVKAYQEILDTMTGELPEAITELSTQCVAAAGTGAVKAQSAFWGNFSAAGGNPALALSATIADLEVIMVDDLGLCQEAVDEFQSFVTGFAEDVAAVSALTACSAFYKPITALIIDGTAEYPLCVGNIATLVLRIGASSNFGGNSVVSDIFAALEEPVIYSRLAIQADKIKLLIDAIGKEVSTSQTSMNAISGAITGAVSTVLAPSVVTVPLISDVAAQFTALYQAAAKEIGGMFDTVNAEIKVLKLTQNPVLIPQLAGAACSKWVPLCKMLILSSCFK